MVCAIMSMCLFGCGKTKDNTSVELEIIEDDNIFAPSADTIVESNDEIVETIVEEPTEEVIDTSATKSDVETVETIVEEPTEEVIDTSATKSDVETTEPKLSKFAYVTPEPKEEDNKTHNTTVTNVTTNTSTTLVDSKEHQDEVDLKAEQEKLKEEAKQKKDEDRQNLEEQQRLTDLQLEYEAMSLDDIYVAIEEGTFTVDELGDVYDAEQILVRNIMNEKGSDAYIPVKEEVTQKKGSRK